MASCSKGNKSLGLEAWTDTRQIITEKVYSTPMSTAYPSPWRCLHPRKQLSRIQELPKNGWLAVQPTSGAASKSSQTTNIGQQHRN
eukprot:scaffold272371_cov17-Tisochrysis_lutea.AAC.1